MRHIVAALRWRRKEKKLMKYVNALLSFKIKLQEIPRELLRDPFYCMTLYLSGFRADRGISKEQYLEDLDFLENELLIAKAKKNAFLTEKLTILFEDMKSNLKLFDLERG